MDPKRTGIERRHFAADGEATSDLGAAAAEAALADAGLTASDLDAIVVATSTPDYTFPSVATMIQSKIGMTGGFAFDVQAVCAGFRLRTLNANAMILSGQANRVMVIGAETFSRILDWTDRTTSVLFGDGAGALILERRRAMGRLRRSRYPFNRSAQRRHLPRPSLCRRWCVDNRQGGLLRMQGNQVFRHAVEKLAQTAHTALEKAGLSGEDVDWIVPHQANIRIIEGTAKRMQVPMEQVVVTVQDHGNTSAASIPLSHVEWARQRGQIKTGDLIVDRGHRRRPCLGRGRPALVI
jgi:3-oxoacyl-[acyl-carrier-protein] synthase-3